jgi:hypothetical protein
VPFGGHGPSYLAWPALLRACSAPAGSAPGDSDRVALSRLNTTQCTYVPPGASGSVTTSASEPASAGTPDHCSGGDSLRPVQVYRCGTGPPSSNAGLVSTSVAGAVRAGSVTSSLKKPQLVSTAAATPAATPAAIRRKGTVRR